MISLSKEGDDLFFKSFLRRKAEMPCDDLPAAVDDKRGRYCLDPSESLHDLGIADHDGSTSLLCDALVDKAAAMR